MKTGRGVLIFFLFVCMAIISSCKTGQEKVNDDLLRERAQKLCETKLMLDSHIDWPFWIHDFPENISQRTQKGDFDYVRAREGGLDAVLSVLYIDPSLGYQEARLMVDTLLDNVTSVVENNPDKFTLQTGPDGLVNEAGNNRVALIPALENGSPVGHDIGYLGWLKEKGIQYITLCHIRDNQICDSNGDTTATWNGLSPFGYRVIEEMNRLGLMIDISHSSDSSSFQALAHSQAPVIASHSACRHFTPGYERCLSDTLIKIIAQKNGVVMVNLGSQFMDSVYLKNWEYLMHYYDSTGISEYSDEGVAFARKYGETNRLFASSEDVANHIDHIVKLVGIDYVGIGSDYDGIGYSQPSDMPDVSAYPQLVYVLLKRGYSDKDIEKVLSGNFIRVWSEVKKVAESLDEKND